MRTLHGLECFPLFSNRLNECTHMAMAVSTVVAGLSFLELHALRMK